MPVSLPLKISFFLVGFQKCATTWLHRCFDQHPQIYVPKKHMIHYFDIKHYEGITWYKEFYQSAQEGMVCGDTTVTYARDLKAIKRIADFNHNAKILLSLRNPIERAFSHYWHEKKKNKINFSFEECLVNYDLYDDWIRTGFYSHAIDNVQNYFAKENIKILLVDDICSEPEKTIQEVYSFLGVRPNFSPPILHSKVNVAWSKPQKIVSYSKWGRSVFAEMATWLTKDIKISKIDILRKFESMLKKNQQSEYEVGMDSEFKQELKKIFAEEIAALSALLNRDLSCWIEKDV